jgi:hypothetical protein
MNNFLRHLAVASLLALAWSLSAFCGEIHEASKRGNLANVKALLMENPNLVHIKDRIGDTPLHIASEYGGDAPQIRSLWCKFQLNGSHLRPFYKWLNSYKIRGCEARPNGRS